MNPGFRVGFGYDIHGLAGGRRLVIGGVEIPFHLGLLGHSDADVLLHSVMDALLGAAGMGDIGVYFPPSDPAYKDASSLSLLEKVAGFLVDNDWQIANIDATIIAESPKLSPYFERMRVNISSILSLNAEMVNIKATTSEGLGFCGRGEGMASYAVALIYKGNSQ